MSESGVREILVQNAGLPATVDSNAEIVKTTIPVGGLLNSTYKKNRSPVRKI